MVWKNLMLKILSEFCNIRYEDYEGYLEYVKVIQKLLYVWVWKKWYHQKGFYQTFLFYFIIATKVLKNLCWYWEKTQCVMDTLWFLGKM